MSCCNTTAKGDTVADETSDPNVFEEIVSPIMDLLEHSPEPYSGDAETYTLSFQPFLLNMLFGIINGHSTVGLIVTQIASSQVARTLKLVQSSKTGYHEAFHRYGPEQYRCLFAALLKSVAFMAIPELQSLGPIYLVDGSVFPAISSMVWAQYQKNHNAIKLHLCFNLNHMIPVQFLSTHAKWSERKFLRSIIEKGITYICDRGYASFAIFHEIVEKSASFIMRGKNDMVFSVVSALPLVIPVNLSGLMTVAYDVKAVFKNDPHKREYRIVSFVAGHESYLLITNRFELTTYQIIMLYAYRWQIELIFRLLKRTMKGLHLMVQHPKGIETQFYLYMIAYLLLLSFKQKCASSRKPNSSSCGTQTASDVQSIKHANDSGPTDIKSSGRLFVCGLVSMLGERLREYWKLGLHWLTSMRNSLAMPARLAIAAL